MIAHDQFERAEDRRTTCRNVYARCRKIADDGIQVFPSFRIRGDVQARAAREGMTMSMMPKLRVLAAPGVFCPHHESQGQGNAKRFVGRRWDPTAYSFVATGEPVEVPTVDHSSPHYADMWGEYAREVRTGALLAADAETAKVVGVKFNEEPPKEEAPPPIAKTPAGDETFGKPRKGAR